MRSAVRCLSLLLLFVCPLACVGPGKSSLHYQDPTAEERIKNETTFTRSFDDTWDLLIGQLGGYKFFFVINNVEKASRIINLSFSNDKPQDYVDCGITERSFAFQDEKATYNYPVSGSTVYKYAGSWGPKDDLPAVTTVMRKAALEGRINIYVAPKDNETIVTVNTRYVLTIRSSGQTELFNGYGTIVDHRPLAVEPITVSFNTGYTGILEDFSQGLLTTEMPIQWEA